MDKVLEALERLKTAPTFMGGTAEYQACTKSETLLMQDYETIKQFILKAQAHEKENAKYKDLEEQIGCPLEVLFEAQINGFYGKTKEEVCFYNPLEDFIVIDFRLGRIQVALSMDFYNVITFYLSDYKKTWWLKKRKKGGKIYHVYR